MEETGQDLCYGSGSIAGAVIGTFLTTVLLLAVAVLLYRQWRRHKGKHLVLVTDPEIVDDAYAFDNPCFKDATPAQSKSMERPLSVAVVETPIKDTTRWSTPWSTLGIGSGNKHDKRRTLDDSCLGPKATRVSAVSLRSRDFTGLGFNVCGNMREGIFVKDLLHRGPASESGRIHPGDRILSVKISFRSMVYEDALTILSYASPYDVELEVESGGTGSRPTTLLKKSVGPSPTRICHPLYRSQSIPELSRVHKSSAKRLFIADPNESLGSNYSTMNSTIKSSKSTPGSHTLERRHEEAKSNNHHKFGIKVLPALDGTVHRIENQNEHNTNLERSHSRKADAEKKLVYTKDNTVTPVTEKVSERLRQRENSRKIGNGIDATDSRKSEETTEEVVIPSEVPAEVHNAAMAARRNRKNSAELLNPPKSPETSDLEDKKSPQKNKRKAPAPPGSPTKDGEAKRNPETEDRIDSIADYTESLNEYVGKVREAATDDSEPQRSRVDDRSSDRRNSESDTDSEMQHSFTTIELNPSDITIHHTPVPRADESDADDVYRKAASLGDLSKYEAKSSATLERAQSLDMADAGSKKRKAPLPPEDIAEFTEDLTKLDDIETFDRRKLKKSSEWGTLEDAIWKKTDATDVEVKPKTRKKSSGTLERSKSAVEIKLKEESGSPSSEKSDDCSIELYNLPLSKNLTRDFINAERMFNPDEDNSLARIVNNGEVVKSPTLEEIELDFREAKPLPDEPDKSTLADSSTAESFDKALRLFDLHTRLRSKQEIKVDLDMVNGDDKDAYVGKKEVREEPVKKITVNRRCPGCERGGHHDKHCALHIRTNGDHNDDSLKIHLTETKVFEEIEKQIEPRRDDDDEVDDGCDIESSVTVNSKRVSSPEDRHNVSNISVSSGENSEDSGLVGESGEYNADSRPPLPNTPAPTQDSSRKLTYITEIKVLPRENMKEAEISESSIPKPPRGQVMVTSNGKPTPGKKPPVPPRRNDAAKAIKDASPDKQVVYVSEFKSPEKSQSESADKSGNKKFEHWIFLGDKEQNSWGGSSSQPQPVTNIVVSSGDEKIYK